MAHINAFCRVDNDTRSVGVGGRSQNNSVRAWLNTATQNGEFDLTAKAEVMGQGLTSKDRRKYGDDREVCFTVELPKPDETVTVRIRENGAAMGDLVGIGALLCAVKGLQELDADDPDTRQHGVKCLEFSVETLTELRDEIGKNLPNVILPGGVTLAHALACVEMCKARLEEQENPNQN